MVGESGQRILRMNELLHQAKVIEGAFAQVQRGSPPGPVSAEDVRVLTDLYYRWYYEAQSLIPSDLMARFTDQYDGRVLGYNIQRFLSDPTRSHVVTLALGLNKRPGEKSWSNPYQPTFHDPFRVQQQVLIEAKNRLAFGPFGSPSEAEEKTSPAQRAEEVDAPITPTVFIGHGHSPLWRELKDYIQDDLELAPLFFEAASHVGEHLAEVLITFLSEANCAITLLTREDEQVDGRERARQNVIHETGYFQGKLGFKRVAMVIQRDAEEFSNVAGIVPIYFEGRQIRQAFPELTRWLKREGFVR